MMRIMKDSDRTSQFCNAIWEWYGRHKRTLPWRDMDISDDSERAYRVLASEVMLQQTQVSRVTIVFKDFLSRFSSLESLAAATNAEVILAWKGMGYNSRALRLRDAAKSVVEQYNGVFPHDFDALLSIKGLGPYTAAAIRNFAFNIPTPCIDTNIRRILHRTFVGPETVEGTWSMSDKKLLEIAASVLGEAIDGKPDHDARNWHAALMDFGSLVQTKNNPKWDICPLTDANIMLTTPANWIPPVRGAAKEKLKKEPGRMLGSTYIPNRIFRGRIVEALREHPDGLSFDQIGAEICTDWAEEYREWLKGLLVKLETDGMLREKGENFILG